MILAGDVRLGSEHYIMAVKTTSRDKRYFVYSVENTQSALDIDKRLVSYKDLASVRQDEYLLGVFSQSRTTGQLKQAGNCDVLRIILDNVAYAKGYTFLDENVNMNSEDMQDGVRVKFFDGADSNLQYTVKRVDGEIVYMRLVRGVLDMELFEARLTLNVKNIKLKEVLHEESEHVAIATLQTITLSDLDASLDMSWYHVGDKVLKDYSNVKNVYEFETRVITPIIKEAIKAHEAGSPLIVTLDTETTGLNIFNLAPDNPSRAHCVAVQLSWAEDQGIAIFNDMQHFVNVDIEYTMRRLSELFGWYKGSRKISYWETDTADNTDSTLGNRMHLGHTVSVNSLHSLPKKTITVDRGWFFLVGHNIQFDRRTCYQTNKTDIWFNADTVQMAFDLNPQTVRGNNKLKNLTRRLFGHETPELTDILGRGNEDKYKYLVDETVANIYGCADVDYTRKVFFVLRSLMSDAMWKHYLQQDIDLPNILAISEYNGMMTYPDKVRELAEITAQNLEILKEAAYKYVGVFQDYTCQRQLIESAYSSGLCSRDEYEQKINDIKVDPRAEYRFEFKASSLQHVLYEILRYPIIAWTDGKIKKPKVDKYVMAKLAKEKRKENSTARRLEKDILSYGSDREEYERLKNGTPDERKKAEHMCLVSAEKFNKLEYPFAMILQQYAMLNKEYTSYYKPILTENLEGKIFKTYNMARIETRRIANPGQTMKGNLKALVRSYSDDYYVLDFDMSQVEYRIMLSLSGFSEMVNKMKNPERDYHTETSSTVNHIPPHKVSKKQRKQSKSVSFGVPYGLGDASLCETMFGEITKENLVKTRIVLSNWKENNAPVMELLESARAQALELWEVNDSFRDFIGAWKKDKETKQFILDEAGNKIPLPISRVTNKLGFYRIFNCEKIGQSQEDRRRRASGEYTAEESSIRRKAGNFPIQSFAAELFRTILTRFYWRCVQEGIEDKIIWHMLIHDELLCSVHKSLHPMYIYKLVKESCMITMRGHTSYFVGINIGDTWAECKDDAREAPVYFVERMIKKWDDGDFAPEKTDPANLKNGDVSQGYWFDHPWDFIKPLREQYVHERIGEELRSIWDIDNNPINVPELLHSFSNYTVRSYVNDYPVNGMVDKSKYAIPAAGDGVYDDARYDDAVWSGRLESWALREFGEGKEFIDSDGNLKKLKACLAPAENKPEPPANQDNAIFNQDIFDDIELEDFPDADDYWSFDDEQLGMTFEQTVEITDTEYDIASELNMNVTGATSVSDFLNSERTYKTINLFGDQLRISYSFDRQLPAIKEYLKRYACTTGYTITFKDPLGQISKWIKITDKAKLDKIDSDLSNILEGTERMIYANRI